MKRILVLLTIAGLLAFGCQGKEQSAESETGGTGESEGTGGLKEGASKLKEKIEGYADTSVTVFREGVEKYEKGLYTEAAADFEKFVAQSPASPLVPLARQMYERAKGEDDRVAKLEKKWDFAVKDLMVEWNKKEAGSSLILCPQIVFTVENRSNSPIDNLKVEAQIRRATDDIKFGSPIEVKVSKEEPIQPGQSKPIVLSTCDTLPQGGAGLLVYIKINGRDYKRIFMAP